MWKNRVNWRVPRSYHTTLRTWMGHFVPPAARLWIYGIIITFYLNKTPQILPMSSVIFLRLCIVTHHEGQMFLYIPFLVTSIPSDSYSGKGKVSSCGGSLFSMFVASHSLWIGWFPVYWFLGPSKPPPAGWSIVSMVPVSCGAFASPPPPASSRNQPITLKAEEQSKWKRMSRQYRLY